MSENLSFDKKDIFHSDSVYDTDLLNILTDIIPDSIYFKDNEHRFVMVNKAKALHSNVKPEEMIGKTDFDFLPEEQARKAFEDDEEIVKTGKFIINKIEKITHVDGSERWISVTKVPRFDSEGNIVGTAGISRDITDQKESEKALHDSEKRYRSIFENSAVAIMMTDENEQIISWNEYTEHILGMGKDDLLEKPVNELYPKDEWLKIRLHNVREKGMQHHLETKMIKKDNSLINVDVSISVLKDHDGKIIGSIGVIRDISKRKQVEKKLKESEEKYRTIFENSAVAIMMTNENEQIISWNEYTEHILGMGKDDLYMKSVESLYPPDEWEKIRAQNVRQKGMQHHLETKILRKNNEPLDVDISVSVLKDDDGIIIGSIGVIRDIAERKKVEEQMKIKDSAIASSINGIVITDMHGNITYVNDSYLKIWGYTTSDMVIGEPIVRFWRSKGRFMEVMDSLLSTGGWTGELVAEKRDGSIFFAHLSATTIKNDDDEPICMMASFVDITEQKKAEEKIKESEKAKSEFMNIAAHELKSPIIPIKGYLEMLICDKSLDVEKKEWIDICLRNINNLVLLVNDILDVARLESNSMNLVVEDIDIIDLIKGVVKDMQPAANVKNLFLKSEIDEVLVEVNVDKHRIMQVLRNLINNAVKCTDDGGITVKAVKDENQNRLVVSVLDTGIGISEEDLVKLFKRFSQLDSGESRKIEGTGLGLYISRGIIEKHNGEIWVESPGIGMGSSFNFSLPL